MRRISALIPILALTFPAVAADLPHFSLKDPAGAVHTHKRLLERGSVVIVTIPNIKHGSVQSRYVKHLTKLLSPDGPRLVIIEDLSQSNVRGMAVRNMKANYSPGASTLLLLDESGALRRSLRVPRDETAVLIFDREGRLLQRVTGLMGADDVIDASRKLARTAGVLTSNARRDRLPTVAEK